MATGNMVTVRLGADGADYGRLMTCGSVWACPVCSARILWERSQDIAKAVSLWEAGRGRTAMATLTVRHDASQPLKTVWATVAKAWSRLTSGRPWQALKGRIGLEGWMRTVEVTHGANGWHVHLHVLLFVAEGTSDSDIQAGGSLLVQRWVQSVEAVGGSALTGPQDVKPIHNPGEELGQYVSKHLYAGGPEAIAAEMARQDLKSGRFGRTPFQILQTAIESGERVNADWALWREFEKASHRKRMHTWSQGFRDALGMDELRTDEEIAADDTAGEGEAESVTVGLIGLQDWKRVRGDDGLYYGLLQAVEQGTQLEFCDRFGIKWLPPGAERNFYAFRDADLAPSVRAYMG